MTNDLRLIHTQGLDEGIRCAMCTNTMKSDKGCDGGCAVDQKMYEKVLKVVDKALEAQPTHGSTYGGVSWGGTYKEEAQPTVARETIIKSALKYLVKMQIEQGSVGFAVDNDHDHDCTWDDVLAWIEAQPTDAVSKSELMKLYKEWQPRLATNVYEFGQALADLPSVIPQTVTEFADKCKESEESE